MPLDVQRTMFAARQSEMARRQASESQKQANSQHQMVNTQSQLNNLLKEQRDFYEKEFSRLSKMASAKGQQDAVRGTRSTVKDPRQQEYYDLAQEGVEAGGIQSQQAAEAARQKAMFDTQMKGMESEITGQTSERLSNAGLRQAKAQGQDISNVFAPQREQADIRKTLFQGGEAQWESPRFEQELALRGAGASQQSINLDMGLGTAPQQLRATADQVRTINSRISQIEQILNDPAQQAIGDPAIMGRLHDEYQRLMNERDTYTQGGQRALPIIGDTGRGSPHPEASRAREEQRPVDEASREALIEKLRAKYPPRQ